MSFCLLTTRHCDFFYMDDQTCYNFFTERFEDTKWVIRRGKSKDRHYNGRNIALKIYLHETAYIIFSNKKQYIETRVGVGKLEQQSLTATVKVWIFGQVRTFLSFVAVTLAYSFSKSTKQVFNIQATWYFLNTSPIMVHGQAICIYNPTTSIENATPIRHSDTPRKRGAAMWA